MNSFRRLKLAIHHCQRRNQVQLRNRFGYANFSKNFLVIHATLSHQRKDHETSFFVHLKYKIVAWSTLDGLATNNMFYTWFTNRLDIIFERCRDNYGLHKSPSILLDRLTEILAFLFAHHFTAVDNRLPVSCDQS